MIILSALGTTNNKLRGFGNSRTVFEVNNVYKTSKIYYLNLYNY